MPIYAPALPPSPNIQQNKSPILVMARFDIERILRQKLGRFFGYVFLSILLIKSGIIYVQYLMNSNSQFEQVKDFASQLLPQPADFQASLLDLTMLFFLWLQIGLIGGGLISRDTSFRIRPLIYAHPVRPLDYLASKALVAFGIPFCIQLPFIFFPWLLSMFVAGPGGPVWPTAPLHLIPAAILNSVVMASVTLGASSLANTPKAGTGLVVGLFMATDFVGAILSVIYDNMAWRAISPLWLTHSWPKILCGAEKTLVPFWPAAVATVMHACLWIYIAKRRTRPTEAVI